MGLAFILCLLLLFLPHQAAGNSIPKRASQSLRAWEILCASGYESA